MGITTTAYSTSPAIPLAASSSGALERWLGRTAVWHLAVVLLVSAVIRLSIVPALDTVTSGCHATDYGSIARNYYRHGFQFLYPQIDWGGDGPGYVEMEFPIVPYITALMYGAIGQVDDRLGAVVPFAGGLLTVLFTYLLARRLFGPAVAFVTGLFLAVSPVFVRFSQLFFPESLMLAASVAAIYWALTWVDTGRWRDLVLAAAATSLAVLLKPTSLVLGVPLFWIFYLRYGLDLWRRAAVYVFGALALIAPVLWYHHALQLALAYHNSFGILFGGGSNKLASLTLLLSPDFYTRLFSRLTFYHLTPIGIVAMAWALLRHGRFTPAQRTVLLWFWASAAALFIVASGNYSQPYYQLPFVVPASIVAAIGLLRLDRDLASRLLPGAPRLVSAALLVALGGGALVGSVLNMRKGDYVVFTWPQRVAAMEMAKALRPDALIVYAENGTENLPRGAHVTTPYPFYFSDHRGWYFENDWVTIPELDELRGRGAQYFVLRDEGVMQRRHRDVTAYLDGFERVDTDAAGEYLVWDLTRRVRNDADAEPHPSSR